MTFWTSERPRPSALRQWWVLTTRVIAPTVRNGELLIAISLSTVFTASFYIPLRGVMTQILHRSYAQYLMPSIVLQTVYFAAMSAALRSATDEVDGVSRRFRTMPIPPVVPLAARMSGNVYRCVVGVATAMVWAHVIGFRFERGWPYTLAFFAVVLLIGIVLALVGDLIGIVSTNPESTTHIILLPVLTLGMLSVGFQPAEQFPAWIQPFVRNQVLSQFVNALHTLAGDGTGSPPAWSVLTPALLWLAGILVLVVYLYSLILGRRR
jgi:ABC-2 type transport system permease protein